MSSTPEDAGVTSAGSETPSMVEKINTHQESVRGDMTRLPSNRPDFVRPVTGIKWFLICVGIFLGAGFYGPHLGIARPDRETLLGGVGFPLGSVATILLIGLGFGTFEVKYLYIASLFLFEVGSAICGSAPTMDALIAGRVIAGVGGAGIYLGALTYMTIFTTLRERPIYMAAIGLSWGIGCILGPVIGGAFSDSNATWRWSFYINLVLAAVTAPIYLFLFPKYPMQAETPFLTKLARIDWVGSALVAAAFVLFIVVLSYGGVAWAWGSGGVIALWVVFGVVVIALILQQRFKIFTTREARIYPAQFLTSRTLVLLYIGTACSAASLFVPVYFVPVFFQFTKNDSAIDAAVRLLPYICLMVVAMMSSGVLMPIIGYYMPIYIVASVFMLIGGALMFTITSATPVANIYGFEILIAIGAGLSSQLAYSVAATKVKPQEIPAAIGFINVAQIGSIALTGAIAGSVFQNVGFGNLQRALAGQGFTDEELRGALSGAQSAILSSAPPAVRQAAVDSIAKTIGSVFGLIIAAGALSLIASAAMRVEKFVESKPAAAPAPEEEA